MAKNDMAERVLNKDVHIFQIKNEKVKIEKMGVWLLCEFVQCEPKVS